jgi:hypothetical protein
MSLICSVFAVSSSAAEYGDINCDGDIKVSDAVLLAQYLALWDVNISDEGMEAADVRHDGKVNTKDAVLLAQYLALWEVTLGPDSGNDPVPPVTDPDTPEVDPGTGDNEVPADDLIF